MEKANYLATDRIQSPHDSITSYAVYINVTCINAVPLNKICSAFYVYHILLTAFLFIKNGEGILVHVLTL